MALALNTSHPLYSQLIALVCVDDDNTVKDLTGNNTCTPHANVTIGSGTYGRHFQTAVVSSLAQGIALSPGPQLNPLTGTGAGLCTVFVAVNNVISAVSRGAVFNAAENQAWSPAVASTSVAGLVTATGNPTLLGTTDVLGEGALSFGGAVNAAAAKTFVNGVTENSQASAFGNKNDNYRGTYIGGVTTGGQGGLAAQYVWVAVFRGYVSDADLLDLHDSLGASNAFALVGSAGDDGVLEADAAATATATAALNATADALDAAAVAQAGASANLTTDPAGYLHIDSWKNNTGTLLASETGITVRIYNKASGALVVALSSQSTDASGNWAYVSSLIDVGTDYVVVAHKGTSIGAVFVTGAAS